ncbi:MAG: thiamine phosphate synthase [Eggerthellaceae bacterium]|nr:thiamine phosphate synthase [Eggerthellaceae bacterium]
MSFDVRKSMALYAVTDSAWLEGRSLAQCVEQAVRGGATFVQLREKGASTEELVELAAEVMPACKRAGVPFVVNDDVEAALTCGADGVHVGQEDAACRQARSVLGPAAIVGVSVQTLAQAIEAEKAGATYLGVGAMRGTATKSDAAIVSLEELRAICERVSIPVVAIGGLNAGNLDLLAGSGVDGVAVVSALFAAPDIEKAARELRCSLEESLGVAGE